MEKDNWGRMGKNRGRKWEGSVKKGEGKEEWRERGRAGKDGGRRGEAGVDCSHLSSKSISRQSH